MGICRFNDTGEFSYRHVGGAVPKEFDFESYCRNSLNGTAEYVFEAKDPFEIGHLVEIQDLMKKAEQEANKTGKLDIQSLDAQVKQIGGGK
jgi:predicted metal-dependent phosphoesterase TrpH